MTIKIIQSNNRVTEVQFTCNICGRTIHTAFIPKEEVEAYKDAKITCCNCKKTL